MIHYNTRRSKANLLVIVFSDEEWVVGQRNWDPKGQSLEQAPFYMYILVFRQFSKFQMKSRSTKFP